jgi:hypothetical protein
VCSVTRVGHGFGDVTWRRPDAPKGSVRSAAEWVDSTGWGCRPWEREVQQTASQKHERAAARSAAGLRSPGGSARWLLRPGRTPGNIHPKRCGGTPLQFDEFQSQRVDPRDETVQRGSVGQPTHQHGVARRRTAPSGSSAFSSRRVGRPVTRKVYSRSRRSPFGRGRPHAHRRSRGMTASPPDSMSGGDRPSAPRGTGLVDPRFAIPLAANVVVRPRLHARL